jgi:hypothetical protein
MEQCDLAKHLHVFNKIHFVEGFESIHDHLVVDVKALAEEIHQKNQTGIEFALQRNLTCQCGAVQIGKFSPVYAEMVKQARGQT